MISWLRELVAKSGVPASLLHEGIRAYQASYRLAATRMRGVEELSAEFSSRPHLTSFVLVCECIHSECPFINRYLSLQSMCQWLAVDII